MSAFAVGVRVRLVPSHSHAGEYATIIAGPGAFVGWSIRLDSGVVTGAGETQMRVVIAV